MKVLLRDYGEDACADAMVRFSKLTSSFLQHRGFSIGIGSHLRFVLWSFPTLLSYIARACFCL
jgi:hypothetical protein